MYVCLLFRSGAGAAAAAVVGGGRERERLHTHHPAELHTPSLLVHRTVRDLSRSGRPVRRTKISEVPTLNGGATRQVSDYGLGIRKPPQGHNLRIEDGRCRRSPDAYSYQWLPRG
ncbi:hypothetical protein LZ31DRAFT_236525 [Colletotrichum somersetense]|nr:hypothetical protein LZ31DRAFT_236525 [Colletotrichum somersetense]